MITYTDYPSSQYTSYCNSISQKVTFESLLSLVKLNLSLKGRVKDVFGLIVRLNDLIEGKRIFYLNNHEFKNVESNETFRSKYYDKFLRDRLPSRQYGVITFKNRGQFLFLYVPKSNKNSLVSDRDYLCSALMSGNLLLGFEEAIVSSNGLFVLPDGTYSEGMYKGQFVKFTLVALAYFPHRIWQNYQNLLTIPLKGFL